MAQAATPPGQVMPAAFFGHGNPMNALEVDRYTAAWRAFGQAVPRPRAVLVISAHWYTNATDRPSVRRPPNRVTACTAAGSAAPRVRRWMH